MLILPAWRGKKHQRRQLNVGTTTQTVCRQHYVCPRLCLDRLQQPDTAANMVEIPI